MRCPFCDATELFLRRKQSSLFPWLVVKVRCKSCRQPFLRPGTLFGPGTSADRRGLSIEQGLGIDTPSYRVKFGGFGDRDSEIR